MDQFSIGHILMVFSRIVEMLLISGLLILLVVPPLLRYAYVEEM